MTINELRSFIEKTSLLRRLLSLLQRKVPIAEFRHTVVDLFCSPMFMAKNVTILTWIWRPNCDGMVFLRSVLGRLTEFMK